MNEQLKEQNLLNRQQARETEKVFGAYKNLSTRLIRLRREYKNLAAAEKGNTKEARALLSEITKLDSKIKSIDKTVGQSQRNVGNYTSAFSKLGNAIKTGLGFIGLTSLISGFTRVIKDSFNRIREFDKELQNIAGITGNSREELKSLESTIIQVASESIKTSNEVAKLATTLFTLGKTKREVSLLLKPVNDLSIALETTSEEAADFLGQTLNAFGKGGRKWAGIR